MSKKFEYTKTNKIYIKEYKEGKWQEGYFSDSDLITISAMSTSLHYGQQAFEGLKAYRRSDGDISLFRLEENAKRLIKSANRLLMPMISKEEFISIVKNVVLENSEFISEYDKSCSLYIRPLLIGVGPKLGVGPSIDYMLIFITSPVGSYFSKKVNLLVTEYDRVAENGIGTIKAGANYGSSMFAIHEAKQKGYDDCLFLDPINHLYVEELSAANVFGITKDNEYVTPNSNSILKSITNDSLKIVAKDLGMKVIEDKIKITDLNKFIEFSACGTGALISPIESVTHNETKYVFNTHDKSLILKEHLLNIQYGNIPDIHNWVTIIKDK